MQRIRTGDMPKDCALACAVLRISTRATNSLEAQEQTYSFSQQVFDFVETAYGMHKPFDQEGIKMNQVP
jgi:hypothetical protein